MPDTPDPVARINALTTNARNTWFVLLGVLVFVSITLMGVQHIDFYGVDRQTALPLVNVSVPTWLFFYAAPLLITAVYGYFHLYLIRLWDVLGVAKPDVAGTPLGDAITPWLVSDVALKLRAIKRDPNCITPRTMEVPNALWNTLFAWVAGPAVLGWLWWGSMPARDWKMTSLAGICLFSSLVFGYASAEMMRRRMTYKEGVSHRIWRGGIALAVLMLVFAPLVAIITYGRTVEPLGRIRLAPIDLTGEALVEKPLNWLPYQIAQDDFLAVWRKRENISNSKEVSTRARDFIREWKIRRTAYLSSLSKPYWNGKKNPKLDLRKADLSKSFLSGVNLRKSRLDNANLSQSDLEGANLREAKLSNAFLLETKLQEADLRQVRMMSTILHEAQLQGAKLHRSFLVDTSDKPVLLKKTNISASKNFGGALRYVDFSHAELDDRTDWRNVFLDASVTIPEHMRNRIGNPCLWNWIDQNSEPLGDEAFFAHWRGWLALDEDWGDPRWYLIAPEEWRDVVPIAPPADCHWITDPIPGATAN